MAINFVVTRDRGIPVRGVRVEAPMTTEELNQQFSDKVKRGIFRPVDRFISDRAEAEDRLQEKGKPKDYLHFFG